MRVAVKKVLGGLFSNYTNECLKAGQTIDVMLPADSFILNLTQNRKVIILL